MKRLCSLAALMVLASSACSAESISFSVGGHRIRIDASRHCRSTSCASVSVSGLESRSRKDRDDDTRDAAPPPAPAQVSPPPLAVPQNKPVIAAAPPAPVPAPVASAPTVGFATAAASTRPVAALPSLPPVPAPPQAEQPKPASQPCVAPPPASKPIEAAPYIPPAPAAPPPVIKTLHEEESDTPVGDWQTEHKGVVRIAQCGRALCGYTLNPSSNDKGEAVLINMKPKTDTRWAGSVYSRDSGDTYYGTVDLKGPDTLRVEACAFSRFYCSGNNWIRIAVRPLITSRQVESRPRS
jgi:Uncharacterized protein conserved in bacteria (DUF2147)